MAPSTVIKGRGAVEYILRSKAALGRGTLKIDNGSGLSRSSKMSAKILAGMYDNAYGRYGQKWMDTLAIAGIDGTIKKRFRGTVVKNRAWMKTGTLKRVKNIGGYMKARSGKLYTVVVFVNSSKAKYGGAKLQNDIMKWLVEYKDSATKKVVKKESANKSLWSMQTKTPQEKKRPHSSPLAKYYVQAGSFSSIPNKAYLRRIEHLGLPYKVRHSNRYKVLIGAYKDKKSAKSALVKVRKNINDGAFITKL